MESLEEEIIRCLLDNDREKLAEVSTQVENGEVYVMVKRSRGNVTYRRTGQHILRKTRKNEESYLKRQIANNIEHPFTKKIRLAEKEISERKVFDMLKGKGNRVIGAVIYHLPAGEVAVMAAIQHHGKKTATRIYVPETKPTYVKI